MTELSVLVGKVLERVANTGDELVLTVNSELAYRLYHSQNCCESVYIEDVCGDLDDLVGEPILLAEEVSSLDGFTDPYENPEKDEHGFSSSPESYTWTFYKFSTIKGSVTVRWLGTSNGYYSEGVNFGIVGKDVWDD